MAILDDTALFLAVISQGGFSHAAKHLGFSNGLVSRRISQLEATLGVSLIKRTTRQLTLTSEGEIFLQHALRIQQELDSAITLMQASSNKPKGIIRISAPVYFGRHYLMPIIMKFMNEFEGIKINLVLNNQIIDPIKENFDLVIRGAGYLDNVPTLKDSSLHMKLLLSEKIKLYASAAYLQKHGEPLVPQDLLDHVIISYSDNTSLQDNQKWTYAYQNIKEFITVTPKFNCNDIESSLIACASDYGIGRFTELNAKNLLQQKKIQPTLEKYKWGNYQLFAIYSHQKTLPKRSRLLLEFISSHLQHLQSK